uniref:Paired domain-containing protein n=1 Tax=Caenorhabditis tropicalis TaxID=1561998 RepID=A0A1I7TCP6_9PELO
MRASPHRAIIAMLFAEGHRVCDIVRKLNIGQSLVQKVVQQFKKEGHVREHQKRGRPCTVNTRTTRAIIKKRIKRNDGVSMNKISESLGISRKSVQMIVKKDFGLKRYWGKDMWPASSPDLNPMDFSVWGYLESKVMAHSHPDIKSLKQALVKAWDEIDDDYLRRTVDSVPKRLKACIKAKGSNFEHLLK